MGALFLIGERLNSTRPSARKIFEERDEWSLLASAKEQIEGGAACIDLNASMLMEREEEALRWGALAVRETLRVPVMLDSPDVSMLARLAGEFGASAIVNSIPCDAESLAEAMAAAARAQSGVVVMLKDRRGVPATVEGKLELAERAVAEAARRGMPGERLYLDPVFSPIATATGGLSGVLETLRALGERYPACARIGGLSNVSFGMPERGLLNAGFASMSIGAGITALICDTTDPGLMGTIKAAEALAGLDASAKRFLAYHRGRGRA